MKNLFGLNKPKKIVSQKRRFLHVTLNPLMKCKEYETHGTKILSKCEIHEHEIIHYFTTPTNLIKLAMIKFDIAFVDEEIEMSNDELREFMR